MTRSGVFIFGGSALFAALLLLLLLVASPAPVRAGQNGGVPCAACTAVLTLALDLAVIHDKAVDKALEDLCTLLPQPFENSCITFVDKYGKIIVDLVASHASSDDICHSLGVCTDPTCRLFPSKGSKKPLPQYKMADPSISVWTWLEQLINRWTDKHEPIVDLDGDFFSDINTFRGADWRGRDCDDLSNQVYPGRRNTTLPAAFDHNCNGIKGSDRHGNSYESLYCANTGQRGFIGLGDSATAHFRLPPQYFNASAIQKGTFDHLIFLLENEADWPHRSWGTGHLNDTTGDCEGPLQSIYLQLLERNQCNFRDYQNIGVNGARTGSMAPPGIINSMARNQSLDHPALVFYALIGNDVCNSGHSTDSMTTPEDFQTNVLKSLTYLDANLPAGSHVVFVGLVDGRILWDVMHNRTHPIGCTYAELYDFLNCLYISPCWGWMNSNATVRNETAARAAQLNQVYTTIINNYNYTNFDMTYYDFPLYEVAGYWYSIGQPLYELIEPVDGFHPSQITNALIAEYLFGAIAKKHPQLIGPVNPNNNAILQMFGSQRKY